MNDKKTYQSGEYMKNFTFGLFLGFVLSTSTILFSTYYSSPKYAVGTCFSNGLYFEKIIEIRKPLGRSPLYVMDSYIQGKKSLPDTIQAWIVDKNYVEVNVKNCSER